MDDLHGAEETAFVVDEVSNIIKEAVESAIGGNAYAHNKVNQWTSNVVEQCLNQLTKLQKPFKVRTVKRFDIDVERHRKTDTHK